MIGELRRVNSGPMPLVFINGIPVYKLVYDDDIFIVIGRYTSYRRCTILTKYGTCEIYSLHVDESNAIS